MTFALDINKWVQDCEKKQDQFVRKICLDLTSQVVLGTPVDTGRARANWQASINTPASGTKQYSGDKGSKISAPSSSAASNKAIGEAQSAIKQATGNVFYLTNNLPYIRRLEFEGWSKQARQGWVRAAVRRIATTYS